MQDSTETHANPSPDISAPTIERSGAIGSLPRRTFIGFTLAIVAVCAISYLSFRALEMRAVQARLMMDTLETVERTENVLSLIKDAETGQRGYLLTGEQPYLEPYEAALRSLPEALKSLEERLVGDDRQIQHLGVQQKAIERKLAELKKTIELRRENGAVAAVEFVKNDSGKNLMDEIRDTTGVMISSEREKIKIRTTEWDEAAALTTSISWMGSATLLFLILAAAWVSSRDFREQGIQSWLRAGQGELAVKTQGELDLENVGDNIATYLSRLLSAQASAVYFSGDGELSRVGAYALPDTEREKKQATGLTRQAFKDGSLLHVSAVPDDYFPVTSGLGKGRAKELVLAPAFADNKPNAVVELAFFRPVPPHFIELLRRLAEPIGIVLRTAKYRMDLKTLLEETQRQAEELQAQQEELRVNNEELEEQSRALRESQARLEQQQEQLEQTNSQLEEQTSLLLQQKASLEATQEGLNVKGAELERASRYKSEFLANMSHELRTPLNSSLILAKLLAENRHRNLTPEQVKFAESIYSAGNDLLELINDILDLSKIEAGKMDVKVEPVTLARVAESLKQTFQPIALQKKVQLVTSVEPGAPELIVTDAQRMQQIMKNLLSNAFKFTERGSVTLQIFGAPGKKIGFRVKDTGIGIAPAQHEVIFEAFRQADGTTNRKYGGTGLGLSISRDLAKLLGGEITLESAPGEGSTFTLYLPEKLEVTRPAKATSSPMGMPRRPDKAPANVPAVAPKKKEGATTSTLEDDRGAIPDGARVLLVVEDDPKFAKILYDLAHELEFRCLLSESADEGIELAQQYRPAAIVLDMNLPDHSGLTVLDRLKRSPSTRHIPVQVISVEDYAQTALEMGAAGYMLKPVQRDQLAETLSKLSTKFSEGIRSVLVVEDDKLQRESICHLLASQDVRTIAVDTAAAALEQLKTSTVDCMVLDISLPDASGFELLEKMAEGDQYSFPPVIVYTGHSLSADEEQRLRKYSKSIIIKGAHSPERLLDEVTLFLHQVETNLPADRQRMLVEARGREEVFEGRSVLIVEDDIRNIFALTSVLEPKGAKLTIARNGKEALDILEGGQAIELVLMDIMMPEMDGYEAMRKIRANSRFKDLPIISLTAKAMRDDQERCLEAGANDYIAKPIDVEKLLSLMRVWLPR